MDVDLELVLKTKTKAKSQHEKASLFFFFGGDTTFAVFIVVMAPQVYAYVKVIQYCNF